MSTPGPEPESKSVRVLIVSDNPVSRIGFVSLLEAVPHVVVAGGAPVDRAPAAVRDRAPHVVLLDASPPHPGTVGREAEILDLIAAGLTNRQIARRLVIAEKTVKNHAHQIYKRLGATGREHAIARWRELRPASAGGGTDVP